MSRFMEDLKTQKNPAIKQIAQYLLTREDIQENLEKESKSLKSMFDYICNEAKKKAKDGCAYLTDDEVFFMAVHYYDEDDIKIDQVSNAVVKTQSTKESSKIQKDMQNTKLQKKSNKKEKIADNQVSILELLGIDDEDLQVSN